jgi:GrpB-like predicted nucleotidyltransferase (UPF0157 family)
MFAAKETPAKKPAAPTKAPTPPAAGNAPDPAPEVKEQAPPEIDDNEFLVDPAKPEELEAKKPEEAKPQAPDQGPVKAPELRAAYAKVKSRVAELEKQLTEVKSKPVDDTERKTFTDQIVGLNKKLEEAVGNLKFVAYEQSDEYKQKYETPFVETWNEGVQQITTLTVSTDEGTRKGTAEDFQSIMRESDNERAATIATEMFGPNAFYVLSQRRELQKLNNARVKALGEYKSSMAERTKTETEAAIKAKEGAEAARIQRLTTFKKYNEEAATKYPDWFAPLEGDEEGNKLLEKGLKDADLAFQGGNGLTPEQVIKLHSAIRNRSAAFGRLTYRLKQKDLKIAELEKALTEIRGSAPGDGEVGREEKTKEASAFEELEALAKR